MKLVRCALVLFLIFQVGLLGTAVSTLKPHRLAFTARGWVYYLQPGAQIARKLAPGEYPALRPDGMAVAYLRPSTSGAREVTLRLFTLATKSDQIVTTITGLVDGLCWSPDGTRFAFRLRDAAGSSLCTLRADGTERTVIAQAGASIPDIYAPAWSSDGKSLYAHDLHTLYRIALNGDIRQKLPLAALTGSNTAVSSNDRFVPCPTNVWLIAFTRAVPGTRAFDRNFHEPNSALFLFNVKRGTRVRLTPADMYAANPVWTPDGRALYCEGFRTAQYRAADRFRIYRLHPDGRQLTMVLRGQSPSP